MVPGMQDFFSSILVTGDRLQVTVDTQHVTHGIYIILLVFCLFFCLFVVVLLSAHVERFSVSCFHNLN